MLVHQRVDTFNPQKQVLKILKVRFWEDSFDGKPARPQFQRPGSVVSPGTVQSCFVGIPNSWMMIIANMLGGIKS